MCGVSAVAGFHNTYYVAQDKQKIIGPCQIRLSQQTVLARRALAQMHSYDVNAKRIRSVKCGGTPESGRIRMKLGDAQLIRVML